MWFLSLRFAHHFLKILCKWNTSTLSSLLWNYHHQYLRRNCWNMKKGIGYAITSYKLQKIIDQGNWKEISFLFNIYGWCFDFIQITFVTCIHVRFDLSPEIFKQLKCYKIIMKFLKQAHCCNCNFVSLLNKELFFGIKSCIYFKKSQPYFKPSEISCSKC